VRFCHCLKRKPRQVPGTQAQRADVRFWAGAARAGSRSQGAAASGAIRAAYGRFRPERSFPAADGNGLSWSAAVGAESRIVRFRSQRINGCEATLRSEDVCGAYWRSNICCLGLLLDGDLRTWAPIDQVGSLFRHQHDARSLVGSHTILMIWNGRFQPSSNGFVMSTTGAGAASAEFRILVGSGPSAPGSHASGKLQFGPCAKVGPVRASAL
jgi:hypothetical protein